MPFGVPIGQSAGGTGYLDYCRPSEGSALSPFTDEQETRLREMVREECRAACQAREASAPHCHKTETNGMTPPFTAEQSTDIDARIGDMIATVFGTGQYSDSWANVAQSRAAGPDYNPIWRGVSRDAGGRPPRERMDRSFHASAPRAFAVGDRSPVYVDLPRNGKTPAPAEDRASPSLGTLRAPSWSVGSLMYAVGGLLLLSLVRSKQSLSCGGETSHDSAAAGSHQPSRNTTADA